MEHKLKILPQYFAAVKSGKKTFEIRKNDREFKVGDILRLREYQHRYEDHTGSEIIVTNEGGYTGQEITKGVTYILEGGQYGLEEGYCILGLGEHANSIGNCARCGRTIVNHEKCDCKRVPTGIELKNIDLTGISIEQQKQKVSEEDNELIEAIVNRDKNNSIEEFWDCVQVRLGALHIALNITAQEVMEGYLRHLEKIKNRPRNKED